MLLNPLDRKVREHGGIPVLPGAFPIVGHLPAIHDDIVGLFRHGEATLGPLFYIRQGPYLNLVCLAEETLVVFKHKGTTCEHFRKIAPVLLGTSLITQDGEAHRHMRSAMNGPFTPRGLLEAETGAALAGYIVAEIGGWRRGELPILKVTRELALSLIFRMLGLEVDGLSSWRRQYGLFVLGGIGLPMEFPGTPRWFGKRGRAWLSAELRKHLAAARAQPGTGMFHQLVQARDEDGRPLEDEELIDNLLLVTLAGHETTATTMAWLALHLAQEPALWERLCTEAQTQPVPRTPAELRAVPFAEALFREALRLHPPVVHDTRQVSGPFSLLGHTIPIGTAIVVPTAHLSRDPARFPEPDAFRPERWLARREPVGPIETIAFGGGPHFCIGYHVAWMEIVQFAVAMGRLLPKAGLRPRLRGAFPRDRYLPFAHPPSRTRLSLC